VTATFVQSQVAIDAPRDMIVYLIPLFYREGRKEGYKRSSGTYVVISVRNLSCDRSITNILNSRENEPVD
jgi:hypothetical protein